MPILMLTAKSEETDQVVGFSLGADDYVTKPFSVKVLVQRIKALLRRREAEPVTTSVVEHAKVRVDRVRHKVYAEGKEVDLTRTEFRLLECLVRQPGRVYTRPQLLSQAMEDGTVVLERTIDVHVKAVRKKLGRPELIETVRGVGYRFRDEAG
jgi:two-component system phosphate regulon response regulator PhoB